MGELYLAESLQERRHVHPETAAIALTEAVPPADGIVFGAAPRLDGALLGRLLLVGGAELDPVALFDEPRMQVVEASAADTSVESIRPGRTAWAGQRSRPPTLCRSRFRGRAELPWVVFGSSGHTADSRRLGEKQQTSTRGDERYSESSVRSCRSGPIPMMRPISAAASWRWLRRRALESFALRRPAASLG